MFERMIVFLYLSIGASIAFQHPDSQFFTDCEAVKPTVLFCIPSDFSKLFAVYKVALSSWSKRYQNSFHLLFQMKSKCVTWLSADRSHLRLLGQIGVSFFDYAVFSRFSEQVGGNVKMILVSSSGHIPPSHKRFLSIIFCTHVAECYIRTEAGIITASKKSSRKQSMLSHIPILDVKIVPTQEGSDIGEIMIRGDAVVRTHFSPKVPFNRSNSLNDLSESNPYRSLAPEQGGSRRWDDGWFHTYETGQWGPNGSLIVLGHKTEALHVMGNHTVFPRQLEVLYSESDFVQQIVIYARKNLPLIAIVIPYYEVVYRWAKTNIADGSSFSPEHLYSNHDLKKAILEDLKGIAVKHNLAEHLHLYQIHLEEQLIPETLLLQRASISKKFASAIEEMYSISHATTPSRPRRFSCFERDSTSRPPGGFITALDQDSLMAFRPTTKLSIILIIWMATSCLSLYFWWD